MNDPPVMTTGDLATNEIARHSNHPVRPGIFSNTARPFQEHERSLHNEA